MWTKGFLPKEVLPAASPPVNLVVANLAGVNPFPNPPANPPDPGVVVAVVVGCFAVPNEVVLAEKPLVRPVRPPSVVPVVAAGLAGPAPNDVPAGLAALPSDAPASTLSRLMRK